MNKSLQFLLILALLPIWGWSQKTVDNKYAFKDGIYHNLREFQRDQPSTPMIAVEFSAVVSEEKKLVQVAWIRHKNGDTLNLNQIWGICWRGRPYIRIHQDSVSRRMAIFAELQIVGNICLFNYETEEGHDVEFKAYNPLSGLPFRKSTEKRFKTVLRERMMRLRTGEVGVFNQSTVVNWTNDLPDLSRAVQSLPAERAKELLPRMVITYNERKPYFLQL
jgi:hypothetical protein